MSSTSPTLSLFSLYTAAPITRLARRPSRSEAASTAATSLAPGGAPVSERRPGLGLGLGGLPGALSPGARVGPTLLPGFVAAPPAAPPWPWVWPCPCMCGGTCRSLASPPLGAPALLPGTVWVVP